MRLHGEMRKQVATEVRLSSPKHELMRLHVHAPSTKSNAFSFEAQALFDGRVAAQFDLSTRAKHPVPGETYGSAQDSRHLARPAGRTCCARNGTVGRDFPARDSLNRGANSAFRRDPRRHVIEFRPPLPCGTIQRLFPRCHRPRIP